MKTSLYILLLAITLIFLKLMVVVTKSMSSIIYYCKMPLSIMFYYCKKIIKTPAFSNHTDKEIITVPIEFTHKKMYAHGFYSSVFIVNNQTKHISTFFPSNWTEDRVMEAIHQAHNNFIDRNEEPISNKDGIYIVHGFTKENVKIELYISYNGYEYVVDHAYPLFE